MPEPSPNPEEQLQNLVDRSQRVLFTARAVFPWQLVPDRIIIDEIKVTLEYRHIFQTEDIQTILIDDITQVEVDYILFLASLVIKTQDKEVRTLPFLQRSEAVRAKQIVAGLLIAKREKIDLEEMESSALTNRLIEIGKPHPV